MVGGGRCGHHNNIHQRTLLQLKLCIWATTWDFQQCGSLTSVDSDEPVQPAFKLIETPNAVRSVA